MCISMGCFECMWSSELVNVLYLFLRIYAHTTSVQIMKMQLINLSISVLSARTAFSSSKRQRAQGTGHGN